MNLEKEIIIEGYAAFDKETGKGLNNYWSGGSQTGTNKQSLTDDIEKVSICENEKDIELLITWFNSTHKKQVNFEIKKVKLVTKTSLIRED